MIERVDYEYSGSYLGSWYTATVTRDGYWAKGGAATKGLARRRAIKTLKRAAKIRAALDAATKV